MAAKTNGSGLTDFERYQGSLVALYASAGSLQQQLVDVLALASKAGIRFAPIGGLGRALEAVRKGIVAAHPALFGVEVETLEARMLREARAAVDVAERRLDWAKHLPADTRNDALKLYTDALQGARARLQYLETGVWPTADGASPASSDPYEVASSRGITVNAARRLLGFVVSPEPEIPPCPR